MKKEDVYNVASIDVLIFLKVILTSVRRHLLISNAIDS